MCMTRINCGISPKELHYKHLLAEHREIVRIPNAITSGRAVIKDIPTKFTLGKGHVKFFYNKMGYLKDRYLMIYWECRRRGYNISYYADCWDDVPKKLMNDYLPTEKDIEIIRERIEERKPK